MTIRHFLLPADQRERLKEAGGPLADQDLSKMEAALPVVEVDGRIVGYCPGFYALHLEPLWVDPAFRKISSVARGLLEEVANVVAATQEPVSFAIIDPTEADALPILERLGFERVPGDLYYVLIAARTPQGEL